MNNLQNLGMQIQDSFLTLWYGLVDFLPDLIGALLILIIGWIVGAFLGKIVARVVRSLPVDKALQNTGVESVLNRGGISLNTGAFLGWIVKWFVIIAFLIVALDVLGLNQVNIFMNQVLLYIPNVFVAVLVLLVAAVVGDFIEKVVTTSTKSANFKSAELLGVISRWAIWIFGILVALSHLNIAQEFISTLFTGVIAALTIAFGLAFGLGGQEQASQAISRIKKEISK